jgi:hypothetical protein
VNDEVLDVVSRLTRDIDTCKSFRIVSDEVLDVVSGLTRDIGTCKSLRS